MKSQALASTGSVVRPTLQWSTPLDETLPTDDYQHIHKSHARHRLLASAAASSLMVENVCDRICIAVLSLPYYNHNTW